MKRSILPAAVLLSAAQLALAPPPGRAQSFGEEISIVEVEIPVQVLRDGEPVAGLTADDFEVYDRGERREIVGFRVVDLTPGGPPSGAGAGATGDGTAQAEEREGRSILIFFDFLFSRPHYLERALGGVRKMVAEQLHPADRVGVAYLGGTGGALVLGFTRDRQEVATALDAVAEMLDRRPRKARELIANLSPEAAAGRAAQEGRAGSRTVAGELNERYGAAGAVTMLGGGSATGLGGAFSVAFETGTAQVTAGSSSPSGDPVVGSLAYTEPEQIAGSLAEAGHTSAVRTFTLEVDRLVTLLRDVAGQKQLLLLSQGPGSGVFSSFASGQRALVLRYFETMFEALRRGGWTLHAIDVEGIPDPFSGRGFDAEDLFYMANETGGQLYENFNDVHNATALLVERTSLTYVLTIRPGELQADGRLHALEVRLREPLGRGTRVLHRTGYYAPKPDSRKNPLERQMDTVDLLLGEDEVEQLGARLLAGTLPPADGLVPVPVVVEVPASPLLAERPAGRLDLELQLYAVDEHEGVQDVWLRNLQLDLDAVGGALARGGVRVLGGLALPPGAYRLRMLVRDPASGQASLFTTPLTVAADGGGLLPLDPVVVDRSGDWLELVALPSGPAGAPAEALALGTSWVVPPVAPAVGAWQALEFLVVTRAGEEVELTARLLDPTGRPAAPPEAVVFVDRVASREGTLVRHVGRASTAELAPGSYLLEVSARDAAGAERASRSLAFEVRADG